MKELIKELLPPDDNGKPLSALTRWRLVLFIVNTAGILFVVWAVSPWGFARAEDVMDLRSAQADIRLSLIEQKVYTAKESECAATDRRARQFFSERVLELAREYRKISGATLDIPPCPSGRMAGDV